MQRYYFCDYDNKPVRFEKCLKCAEKEPACGIDYGILDAITQNIVSYNDRRDYIQARNEKTRQLLDKIKKDKKFQERHPKVITRLEKILKPYLGVTALTGNCKRKEFLQRRFKFGTNPLKGWWTVRGVITHLMLSTMKNPNLMKEISVEKDMGEWTLRGRIDAINKVRKELVDYKSTNSLWKKMKTGYRVSQWDNQQVNIYRLMWNDMPDQDIIVKKMKVVYFDFSISLPIPATLITRRALNMLIKRASGILLPAYATDNIPPRIRDHATSFWCKSYCGPNYLCRELAEKGITNVNDFNKKVIIEKREVK